ncbi:MAG: hypothetical protein GY816_07745, partial [Cytophagales bacterium]|nr:hypothetical protein [Cytophagales bacterium]
MPDETEAAAATREQRNIRNNVTTLTTEVAGLTTTINAQRNEINENFRTLEGRLDQVEGPQMMHLTGSRSTDSLPNYEGDTDFDDWMSLFNRVKEAYNWTDIRALKILPAYLRGNAADQYNELTEAEKTTFSDLVTNLRAALEPDGMARITQSKLIKRRMQPYESVVDFGAAIQRLVRSAYRQLPADAQDTLMRNHFIDRIRPDIKRFLLLMDPKDFQTAKRNAIQIETHNVELEKDDEDTSAGEKRKGEKKQRVLATHDESDDMKTMLAEILKELRSPQEVRMPISERNQNYRREQSTRQGWPPQPYSGRRFNNPARPPWSSSRQRNWQYPTRGRGQPRPQFRRQGPPSGRLVCYKCGRYDHTAVICPQNRGRTFGGQQPFWRTQYATPRGYEQEVVARPTGISGAINGMRNPVVYQYLPATYQNQTQNPTSFATQERVFLEMDSQNEVNVLQENKEDETKKEEDALNENKGIEDHEYQMIAEDQKLQGPTTKERPIDDQTTIKSQEDTKTQSPAPTQTIFEENYHDRNQLPPEVCKQSKPNSSHHVQKQMDMVGKGKKVAKIDPWYREKIGILRKRKPFCYKCTKYGHLAIGCSKNWYRIYRVKPDKQMKEIEKGTQIITPHTTQNMGEGSQENPSQLEIANVNMTLQERLIPDVSVTIDADQLRQEHSEMDCNMTENIEATNKQLTKIDNHLENDITSQTEKSMECDDQPYGSKSAYGISTESDDTTINELCGRNEEMAIDSQYINWILPIQYDLPAKLPQHVKCKMLKLSCNGTKIIWGINKEVDLMDHLPENDHYKISLQHNNNIEELLQNRRTKRAQRRKLELSGELEPIMKRFMPDEQKEIECQQNVENRRYKCAYCIVLQGPGSTSITGFNQVTELKRHVPQCRRKYLNQMEHNGTSVDWDQCPHTYRHMVPRIELKMHAELLCDKREFSIQLESMMQECELESQQIKQPLETAQEKVQLGEQKKKRTLEKDVMSSSTRYIPQLLLGGEKVLPQIKEETLNERCHRLLQYLPGLPNIESWTEPMKQHPYQTDAWHQPLPYDTLQNSRCTHYSASHPDGQIASQFNALPLELENCIPGRFYANDATQMDDSSLRTPPHTTA